MFVCSSTLLSLLLCIMSWCSRRCRATSCDYWAIDVHGDVIPQTGPTPYLVHFG